MSAQKLVIFDLDGTLIDTVALFVEAITTAFNGVGQTVPDEKTIRSVSGLGMQVGIKTLAPDADDAQVEQLSKLYRQEYLASATASMREALFPGALETLGALHGRDDVLLAVATGKPLRGTSRVLKAHNIDHLFTSLQTPDNNISKPHPEMIHTAMGIVDGDRLRTVMIGDTTHDMEMSVAAGVKALGVSWGYHQPDELAAAGADIVIDEFEAMIDTIDQLLGESDA